MGWRGYIDQDRGVVFFWSQKAACTTLFDMLAANIPERPVQKRFFHMHSVPTNRCLAAIREQGFQSVILVRHPVSRAISAYLNKFCSYHDKPLLRRDDLEVFARDLHDRFCDRHVLARDRNIMTFEDFLETVADLHASRPKPGAPVNGHWETQVPPFLLEEGFRYDTVIRVEHLDHELGALAAQLGMRYQPKALNRTRTAPGESRYLGLTPAHEVAGLRFSAANFVSPDSLGRIRAIYDVDFRMFGYPDLPEGLSQRS